MELVVTGSAMHEFISSTTVDLKYPISLFSGVVNCRDDVKDLSVYIDDFGKKFELLNCHNCTLIFSHEVASDKLAKSKIRLIRDHPVLICKSDTTIAQAYCQLFLNDYN